MPKLRDGPPKDRKAMLEQIRRWEKRRTCQTLLGRFMAQVALPDDSSDCWIWTGASSGAYGSFSIGRRRATIRAHRWIYAQTFGDFNPELAVCHHCDIPRCVNPSHLFVGTIADNNADMRAKRRNGRPPPKIPDAAIRGIVEASDQGEFHRVIASRLGVSRSLIDFIVNGKRRRPTFRDGTGEGWA